MPDSQKQHQPPSAPLLAEKSVQYDQFPHMIDYYRHPEEELARRRKHTVLLLVIMYLLFHLFSVGLIIFYTIHSLARPYTNSIVMTHYNNHYKCAVNDGGGNRVHHVHGLGGKSEGSRRIRSWSDQNGDDNDDTAAMTYYFDWNDYTRFRFHSVQFFDDENDDISQFQIVHLSKMPSIHNSSRTTIKSSGEMELFIQSKNAKRNESDHGDSRLFVESFHLNPGSSAHFKSNITIQNSKYKNDVSCVIIVGDANYRLWSQYRIDNLYVYKSVKVAYQASGAPSIIDWQLTFGGMAPKYSADSDLPQFIHISSDRSSMVYIVCYASSTTTSSVDRIVIANGTYDYSLNIAQYDIPAVDSIISTCTVSGESRCQVPYGNGNHILITSNFTSDQPKVNSILNFQYQVSHVKVWIWAGVLILILFCLDVGLITWKTIQTCQQRRLEENMENYGNLS
mgnify:CR=1 FL=1